MFARAALTGATIAALAAPAAMAAPQMVVNASPGGSFSPSGNMSATKMDCAATDPLAVSVEIHCWTSHGAEARKSDAKAVYTGDVVYTGATGIAFSSFTLCGQATSTYADGTQVSTPVGCVRDDLGFATVL
jgi:hypothetical protein